jgi:chromosome partitioning protein
MNIVVSNVKGGVGKTTTAVYLAGAAAERGAMPVYLVDADRQASTAEWFESTTHPGVELVEAPRSARWPRPWSGEGIVWSTPRRATSASCGPP